jgi:hypothetical protein
VQTTKATHKPLNTNKQTNKNIITMISHPKKPSEELTVMRPKSRMKSP